MRPVWLSGALLTLLNKVVFPVVWVGGLAGLLAWVYATTGRISIARDFYPFVGLVLAATVFMLWVSTHIQRVGYAGKELVVSNYRREVRVPFKQVETAEPVWWYRGRMVKVRFRGETAFGDWVYYLPKWGAIRCMYASPDKELRDLLID